MDWGPGEDDHNATAVVPQTRWVATAALLGVAALIGTVLIASAPSDGATAGVSHPVSEPVSGPVSGPFSGDEGSNASGEGTSDEGAFSDPLTGSFDRDGATGGVGPDPSSLFPLPVSAPMSPPMGPITEFAVGLEGSERYSVAVTCTSDGDSVAADGALLDPGDEVIIELSASPRDSCFLLGIGAERVTDVVSNVDIVVCTDDLTVCAFFVPPVGLFPRVELTFITEPAPPTGVAVRNDAAAPIGVDVECELSDSIDTLDIDTEFDANVLADSSIFRRVQLTPGDEETVLLGHSDAWDCFSVFLTIVTAAAVTPEDQGICLDDPNFDGPLEECRYTPAAGSVVTLVVTDAN